jgi:glyoxylase-like metal-dependent hydrolase (beta-lactamase superfamily II)
MDTPLDIQTYSLGPLETNCHVLLHEDLCWVVDPGMWAKPMVDALREQSLTPHVILLTHGHGDHIGGVEFLKQQFPAVELYCPAADAMMLTSPEKNLSATFLMGIVSPTADRLLQPGETLRMGSLPFEVLDTSGHTNGGVSYYCPQAGVVFTGDALFAGSIGRCDIPDGDQPRLLGNIREHLLTLPDNTVVYPGHANRTTIGREKKHNPFLQAVS